MAYRSRRSSRRSRHGRDRGTDYGGCRHAPRRTTPSTPPSPAAQPHRRPARPVAADQVRASHYAQRDTSRHRQDHIHHLHHAVHQPLGRRQGNVVIRPHWPTMTRRLTRRHLDKLIVFTAQDDTLGHTGDCGVWEGANGRSCHRPLAVPRCHGSRNTGCASRAISIPASRNELVSSLADQAAGGARSVGHRGSSKASTISVSGL